MKNLNLEKSFPNLQTSKYEVTSPRDTRYNCIAWAVGDDQRVWWPHKDGYWPDEALMNDSPDAFIAAYGSRGFAVCENGDHQDGFEKIVIFVKEGNATHAARLLSENMWTSKCGQSNDISHEHDGLTGDTYGEPEIYMSRPLEDPSQLSAEPEADA